MPGDLRPYSPYKTKQSEWMLTKERPKVTGRVQGKPVPFSALPPLPPTRRRQFPVPSDATRFENFAVYWGGRAKGLDLSSPFIYDRIRDNYGITEDRRYQRLYWAPSMITQQPTARHGRQVLLTAY
jgi:hypothetical protein